MGQYNGIWDPQDPFGATSGAVNAVNNPYNVTSGAVNGFKDPYGMTNGVVNGATAGAYGRWQPANDLRPDGWKYYVNSPSNPYSANYQPPPPGTTNDGTFAVIGQDTSGRNADIWGRDPRASSSDGKTYLGTGGTPPGGAPGGTRPPTGANGQPPPGTSYPSGLFNPGGFPNNPPPPNVNPPDINNPGGNQPGFNQPGGTYFQGGLPGANVKQSTMSAEDSLNNYFNTPGYQLLNGQSAVDRFQASPGYQYAVDQAMGSVQKNAAAKGLLESGAVMREMGDRSQQMANQEYNNWHNQQAQQYGDYQNRLQGLAGGNTGSQYAFNTGQLMGQNAMQTGNNLGSLFGNMANGGFSAIMNTGAAYTNNLLNAAYNQVPQPANNTNQPKFTGLL